MPSKPKSYSVPNEDDDPDEDEEVEELPYKRRTSGVRLPSFRVLKIVMWGLYCFFAAMLTFWFVNSYSRAYWEQQCAEAGFTLVCLIAGYMICRGVSEIFESIEKKA